MAERKDGGERHHLDGDQLCSSCKGGYVDRGEYSMAQAKDLMYAVCYGNVSKALGL